MQDSRIDLLNDRSAAESSDNRSGEGSDGLGPSDDSGVGVECNGDDADESKGEILDRLSCDHVVDTGNRQQRKKQESNACTKVSAVKGDNACCDREQYGGAPA